MSDFKASVQYDDFKGTVACDKGDNFSVSDFLKGRSLLPAGQYVVGFRVASNSYDKTPVPNVSLVAFLSSGGVGTKITKVHAIEVDISPGDFFALFKRFDLIAMSKAFETDGVTIDGPHYD